MQQVRTPAVAGVFYPAQPQVLQAQVKDLLAAVPRPAGRAPKALIVPHAGYRYSGATAAVAYAQLAAHGRSLRRVVLLGPVHRVPVRGLALAGATAFATPLGQVPVDGEAQAALAALPQVVLSPAAHALEHSLEVQLPFLQALLGDFQLVPLAVGDASAPAVAEVLQALWGGPETLIVISSDLSHFRSYAAAQAIDGATVARILALDDTIGHEEACGATPINGLLRAARARGLRPRLLAQCNSGDTGGDRQRVVGYAAFGFTEGQP